jgi:putative ABC transport system permease protein
VQTLAAAWAFPRWPQRVFGTVLLVLAAIGLTLATVGLYAVVANSVGQRTHEIGVRVALGAQRREVLLMILRGSLVPFAVGLIVGAAGVAFVGQLLAGFLVDTDPKDPVTLVAISVLMIAVGLSACILPARRATAVDPLVAMRCE